MFTSEYSILECPPLSKPFLMDLTTTTTKWKCTNTEIAPNCPRCASTNTKFCYYNNYSLSQPRYFCKGCRRYWTKGGSLRNVPVGGGCRKSRRARASRQSGAHAGPIPGPGGGGGQGAINEPESATCIDLAAVYAKYVNPNVGNDESHSPGASSGSSDINNNNYNNNNQGNYLDIDNQIEDVPIFEYQKMLPMDLINRGDDQVQQAVAGFSLQPQMDGQDFVYQDFDGFEMQQQGMMGDEMGVDVLWSEEGTSLPNLGSQVQPVMQQVQDFGLFSPDDQFRISANLVPDHWSSFDLSGYELFSNP